MAKYWQQTILDELVNLLKAGELYLFAGAGVSCLAGLPSWKKLLTQFSEAYKKLSNNDRNVVEELPGLLRNCNTVIVDHLLSLGIEGQKLYSKILVSNFCGDCYSDVHRWLLELPFAGYVTTNYDLCFENTCRKKNLKPNLINCSRFCYPRNQFDCNGRDIGGLRQNKPFLLHMHGCIEHNGRYDMDNIILTNNQYGKFYKTAEMNRIYDDCFYEHVLILGTSLKDPYFVNKFREKRGLGSTTNIVNRKKCYVVRHEDEKSQSPNSDKIALDVVYDYFGDWNNGLRNMVSELSEDYKGKVSRPNEIQAIEFGKKATK